MADAHGRTSQRWLVAYDGDCGFCMWLLAGLLRWDRRGACARPPPGRGGEELLGDLDPAERMASWHLISPDGARSSRAAPRSRRCCGCCPAAASPPPPSPDFPGPPARLPLGRREPLGALALGSRRRQRRARESVRSREGG